MDPNAVYQPTRISRSEFIPIRHLNYHVRSWGKPTPGRPPLLMAHGWMDVGASFQFVVDAFARDRWVLAPDWRGFGLTTGPVADSYWFPDYLADLDFLIDHYAPEGPVDLLGHSMGGNVAMLYAGSRPHRVRRLVNLEGFGLPVTRPGEAAGRYARWMDELKSLHRGDTILKPYGSAAEVAQRLMKTNPRLAADKAAWLAEHWAQPDAEGRWNVLGDPAHKVISAQMYRVDEALEIFKRITAPVLAIRAEEDSLAKWTSAYTLGEYQERMKSVAQRQAAVVTEAGHMLHHDQPARVAALIETFLDAATTGSSPGASGK